MVIFFIYIMQEVKVICDWVVIINWGNFVVDDIIDYLQFVIIGELVIMVEFQSKILQQQFKKINGVKEVC